MTFSICPTHGYLRGEQARCPECGEEAEIYSRVVGYLRPVSQWNEGKQAEFLMHESFPWDLVERIGVVDSSRKTQTEEAIGSASHKPLVNVEREWYY